jgi:hypothetical protein
MAVRIGEMVVSFNLYLKATSKVGTVVGEAEKIIIPKKIDYFLQGVGCPFGLRKIF